MNKETLAIDKFVDNFGTVDLEDDLTINKLAITIDELIQPYKVNVEEVGLAIAQDNKALIVKLKNKIAKVFKAKRDHYNAMSKKIIAVEKAISEPLYVAEEELKTACENEHNRQIMQQRVLLLPQRRAFAESSGLSFDDDTLLALNEEGFNDLIQNALKAKAAEEEAEAKKKAWQEKCRVDAETMANERARLDADKAAKLKLDQAKENVKNQKIQEWLKGHSAWDESIQDVKDGFRIKIIENTGYLFKEISRLQLN